MLLLALERPDRLPRPDLHLALELGLPVVGPALPERPAGLALDALDHRARDVMLLAERVLYLLDGEARALPFDPVDRAAGREDGGEHEQQAAPAKHPGSLPEREWRPPSNRASVAGAMPRSDLTDLVPGATAEAHVTRHPGSESEEDLVAVEEPLEIRVGGEPVAVTMRTPGHDEELALGFAVGEGLEPLDAALPADLAANTVELRVRSFDPERLRRHFYTSSSCGVCGKGALEAVAVHAPPVESELRVGWELLGALPQRLKDAQPTFALTGGLHAAGLFDGDGTLVCVREDVGRHNALDKVVGWAFRRGLLPIRDSILCLSGRLSFELVQKAALAGCPILVGVGAPSSLAVELAQTQGITLCGFVRSDRVSVYANAGRVEG